MSRTIDMCCVCGWDGTRQTLFPCQWCKDAYYCSAECRSMHWRTGHSRACKRQFVLSIAASLQTLLDTLEMVRQEVAAEEEEERPSLPEEEWDDEMQAYEDHAAFTEEEEEDGEGGGTTAAAIKELVAKDKERACTCAKCTRKRLHVQDGFRAIRK